MQALDKTIVLNSEIYELWIFNNVFCWVGIFRLKLQQQIVNIENAEKEKKENSDLKQVLF